MSLKCFQDECVQMVQYLGVLDRKKHFGFTKVCPVVKSLACWSRWKRWCCIRFHVFSGFPFPDDIQGVTSAYICQCHHFERSACRACHMDVPIHLDHFSFYQRYLLRDIEMTVRRRWIDHDHQISIHWISFNWSDLARCVVVRKPPTAGLWQKF